MSLLDYRRKRHFASTPEPAGGAERRAAPPERRAPRLRFVIQKHRARSLHYDFRLEWNGVLLSWAVPKGPSLDPSVKRLAVRVEDHPLEYRTFEGRIPEGQYGAGTVEIWDEGTWRPEEPNVDAALRRGELKFMLAGRRLKGSWVLVRTRLGVAGGPRQTWLLIHHRDRPAAAPGASRAAEPKRRRLRSRPHPL
jgi:bifunctional non-homologous end joining protein LigD